MRATLVSLLALAALGADVGQHAARKCQCVANGVRFEQGQVACLRSPLGPRPARCEKVLNNSAWKFLDGPCGETSSREPPFKVAAGMAMDD